MKQEYIYTPLLEPIPICQQVWPEGTLPVVSKEIIALARLLGNVFSFHQNKKRGLEYIYLND